MSATLRTRARVSRRAGESGVVAAAASLGSRPSRIRRARGGESRACESMAFGEGVKREPSWAVALQAVSYYRVGCFCDSVAVCRDRV